MRKSRLLYLIIISALVMSISCKGNLFNEGLDSPDDNTDSRGNTPPVADNINIVTGEDIQVKITLTAVDAENDTLTWHIDSNPSNGSLAGSTPDLTYTPASAYSGSDSFTYHVNDGSEDSNIATVSITINASSDNTPPVADDMIVYTTVNTPVNIILTASDADDHALNWHIDTAPTHGDISGNAPDLVYTPDSDYTGSDSFIFHVDDGFDDSNIATVNIGIQAQGSWNESDMDFTTGEEQNHIAIGDGRSDGVMRVYSTTNEIHEYTYNDTNWDVITFGDNFLTNSGIAIGDVRNDSNNRVYITKYSVHEHYFNIDQWLGGWVCSASIIDDGLIIGDGRNDGVIRIYFTDRDAIYELSYNFGDWDLIEVDDSASTYAKLVITEGRNDGIKRLYAAIDDHVYEYTWSGSSWVVVDCGVFPIFNSLYSICAGNARNDDKNRIYVAGQDMGNTIFELSYNEETWEQIIVKDNITVDIITIGQVKNDGLNYLYTTNSSGIGEYFYNGSWTKTSNIETSFEVNSISIGNGRNDGVNRLYATGNDNHIYEYSYE
ncbi:MAG: Ig-like domain-containing protein [Spirochaetota bacterium]|nr:Ig-like domain-containing protein [Spirochaetota bacterium]